MSEEPLDTDYVFGDRVEFVVGKDVVGMVTAYCVRGVGYTTYEITWFHNGEPKTKWVESMEIRHHESGRIGLPTKIPPGEKVTKP